MFHFPIPLTVDGFPLWVILLICCGVFLASFMDAIAGGGGIISVPTHLIAFGSLPAPYALGTNKISACIGTIFSTARFIKNGYVNWKLFGPSILFSITGSVAGTWLQHRTPDAVLKYMLLFVLPVVAFITLRTREWPDEPGTIDPRRNILDKAMGGRLELLEQQMRELKQENEELRKENKRLRKGLGKQDRSVFRNL